MACINIKHPEYINLVNKLSEFGITNPVDIQGKIHEYQEETNTDLFPGLDYFNIEDEVVNDVLEKRQNKVQANQQQLSVIQPNKTIDNQLSQKSQERSNQIQEIFNQYPELSKIGTVEQYNSYLDTIGVTNIGYHHSESDLESFTTFSEGYFPKELKKKGTHYKEADDIVFFVKKPLTEEFMSKRKFTGTWGLKIPNTLQFNAGEKVGEGVHPGIDKGIKNAVDGNYDAVDFGRIRDNKTWSEVIAITNPKNAVKLGSKADIQGFKAFVNSSSIDVYKNSLKDEEIVNAIKNPGKKNENVTSNVNKNEIVSDEASVTKEDSKQEIKPGVEELFESNPELANIGTPEQYSQYLDTIFPDSKVKDIVYHGSKEKFDKFDKNKQGKYTGNLRTKGFYFTDDFNVADTYTYNWDIDEYGTERLSKKLGVVIPALININQIKEDYNHFIEQDDLMSVGQPVIYESYVVFESEQIHILGSKQDIEGFKEFVNNTNTLQNFEQYFPDYSYLNEEERIVFIKGIESGDLTITCTK